MRFVAGLEGGGEICGMGSGDEKGGGRNEFFKWQFFGFGGEKRDFLTKGLGLILLIGLK